MTFRSTTKLLVSTGAMLVFGASVMFAQDTTTTKKPTSSKRIPVTKEAGGEVVTPRVDTVTVFRTDTVAGPTTMVHDTVTVSTVRVDTVIQAPMMRPARLPGGFYFGLGGGVSAPEGALFIPNNSGPTAQAQLGWQGLKSLIGVRGDVNWSTPQEDAGFASNQPGRAQIWNFSADAKLQLPFLTHTFGSSHRFAVYGIGGYTHTMFKDLPMRLETADGAPLLFANGNTDWTHENGWNAGGGLSLSWGRNELFFEARALSFNTDVSPRAYQVPYVLGINLF